MMNDNRREQAHLILSSFLQVTGKHLIKPDSAVDLDEKLFEAKFCVLSHNDDPDPMFNYGNRVALELFELNWDELTSLPSRLSAEPQRREERQRLLKEVAEKGYIDNYQGVRVSSSGRRFMVKKSIVWNLIDDAGRYHGQAAVLLDWEML
ncbi:MAG: MEKHLA domain-containing protein [Akkermansiaceae bacterium]